MSTLPETALKPCTACNGHLVVLGSVLGSPEDCGRCNGTGNEPTPCAPCKGSGYGPRAAHDGLPCPECDGSGWQPSDPFADSREGMVSVHDHTGKCIGSMGVETWARLDRETCDHCGGTDIEQRGCSTCGAPVCCRTCCTKSELDTARKVLREVAAERDALRATLDASEDPAVYVSWQRVAHRAETEAKALQGELKALLVRVLEARLEHTCADHSHEVRWGCPECRLVDHMDRRGWESLEAVRDA